MNEPIIIHNISDYTFQIKDGNLVLHKINNVNDNNNYITDKELSKLCLSNSVINKCLVKDNDKFENDKKKGRIYLRAKLCVSNSVINKCLVKDNDKVITDKTNYSAIMKDIWKQMHLSNIFNINQSTYKFVNDKKKGQIYFREINKYYWGKDANGTLKEILNMIKISNYTIDLSIILENGDTINYTNISKPNRSMVKHNNLQSVYIDNNSINT